MRIGRKNLIWVCKVFRGWPQSVIRTLSSGPWRHRSCGAAEPANASRVIIPRAPRHRCHQELAFRRIGEESWSRGTIVNISKSGVLFSADRKFKPPVAVELRFEFPKPVIGAKGALASGQAVIVRHAGFSDANTPSAFAAMYEDIWIDLRRVIGDDRGPERFKSSMLPDREL